MSDNKVISLKTHRNQKTPIADMEQLCDELSKMRSHEIKSVQRFLATWKVGVNYVGKEFFIIENTVDAATDKWQLKPNLEFIDKVLGSQSHGKQVMLGLLYSFYDSTEAQKLLERANTPNLVDALVVLDREAKEIISQLWLNYTGW